VTTTRGGSIVSQTLLQQLPTNRNYQDIFVIVGGMQITGPPLTGSGGQRETGPNLAPKSYGLRMQTHNTFEGLVVQSNEIPNFASFEEVDVKSFGNTAEVASPVAAINMVVKSGGNDFHSRSAQYFQGSSLQSNNIDADLRRQGITAGDAIVWQNDLTTDIGGRIIRDKLWFYYALKDVRAARTVPGFVTGPGPDGRFLTGDEPIGKVLDGAPAQTIKISFQPTRNHRFVSFYSRTPLFEWQQGADRFNPLETTVRHQEIDWAMKPIEWQWVINNRMNFTMFTGASGLRAIRNLQSGYESQTPTLDRETQLRTGASFLSAVGLRHPRRHRQLIGRFDFFPERRLLGSHAFQSGFRYQRGGFETNFPSLPYGDYQVIFDRVGGVSGRPVELAAQDRPTSGDTISDTYALYLSDSWRPSRRLTLNLGVRWDRNENSVPPISKAQGRFGLSGEIPRIDAGTFNNVAPRLGVAYDLFGNGNTVIKSTYNLFRQEWMQYAYHVGFAFDYNRGVVTLYNYRWNDPNGNRNYETGEVDLSLSGPAFISVAGATNRVPNLDLDVVRTHEVTGSIEQSLGRTLSLRGLYVHKRVQGNTADFNIGRPQEVYNRQFNRRDPGPDGALGTADDGGIVTFYDFDPAFRAASFVTVTRLNADSDHQDTYDNAEVSITKRQAGKWFGTASILATKYATWFNPVPQSPNDLLFPMNRIWEISGRIAAGYNAPYGINLSTLTQFYNGIPRLRTHQFRTADPAGGPSLPSSSIITLRMEEYGKLRGPNRVIVNMRGSRRFKTTKGTIGADIEAFNVFNSNVPWATGGGAGTGDGAGIIDLSGPTYNFVTRIVNPRIIRFGITYEF